jgi:hypothetical protein
MYVNMPVHFIICKKQNTCSYLDKHKKFHYADKSKQKY